MPDKPTEKALREMAQGMKRMLEIGWPKESLDELERLWWIVHDNRGDIRPPTVQVSTNVSALLREAEEALRRTLPILTGALAFVDCKPQIREVHAVLARIREAKTNKKP